MSVQKDKVIEFTKRLVINAASQAINLAAPIQFAIDVARDFHDVFITADEDDRVALIESARSLSNAEREALIAEIRHAQGEAAANATRGVLETLRVGPSRHQALQTINSQMLGGTGQTLTPRPLSAQQRVLGSAVASFMMGGAARTSGAAALSRSDWPTVPGYELTDFLGSGSFANVFLAQKLNAQGQIEHSCALKVGVLRDEGRFRREVQALSAVSHPNLIDYYGSGTLTDTRPPQFWISMPNLSGLTLADLMRQELDLEQKLLLASQILSGLKALHSASLTHRDLKPENALIGDNYELKLTDFGLSKSEMGSGQGSLATMQGEMMGTPAYMSPEQVQSKPVESYLPSDVWAFGVILFELLTGRLIFTGNLGEVWGKIQYEPIQLEDPAIPPTLLPILRRCVVRDLSQRFNNAIELSRAFDAPLNELRRKLRHERYRGRWTRVIDEHLLERFAERYRGQLPANYVEVFAAEHPNLPEVDPERLTDVLPIVFKAQEGVEAIKRQTEGLMGEVDLSAEIEQAEAEAMARLGISSIDEALRRAAEVDQVKRQARSSAEGQYAVLQKQRAKAQETLASAHKAVEQAVKEALRVEMTDYTRLKEAQEREARAERELLRAEARQVELDKAKTKRRVIWTVVLSVLIVVGIWLMQEYAKRARIATAERAGRERIAAAERAERERIAAAERAERERIAAAEHAERERIAAAEAHAAAEAQKIQINRTAFDKRFPHLIKWINIPDGQFLMGSVKQVSSWSRKDKTPVHNVQIRTFKIMKTEVTVGQYEMCVNSTACDTPIHKHYLCNWGQKGRKDHPINCLTWHQARNFAKWVGGDLPTEAQWEYVARSRDDQFYYPWGSQKPKGDCKYAVLRRSIAGKHWCGYEPLDNWVMDNKGRSRRKFKNFKPATLPVCSKRRGNSKDGICDLLGNVREFMLDEYQNNYSNAKQDGSALCSTINCDGIDLNRVLRGGSFYSNRENIDSTTRSYTKSQNVSRFQDIGFRVVRNLVE